MDWDELLKNENIEGAWNKFKDILQVSRAKHPIAAR